MTSQINYSAVDSTYPVAGQDNDSQGFRDNFAAIKTALQYAKSEITSLQNNTAALNSENNFAGNVIYNAELKYNRQTVYNLGEKTGDVDVNFEFAQVQTVKTGGNINLTFTGWPIDTKSGTLLLIVELSDPGHVISFPAEVVKPYMYSNPTIAGKYFLEFTTNNHGTTIFLNAKPQQGFYSYNNTLLTGAGAIDLTGEFTSLVTNGANAYTLADGVELQRKTIVLRTKVGNATVTPTNALGFSNIVFDSVGDTVSLIFINGYWHVTGSYGVTINT